MEKDNIRADDSFNAFEEVLQLSIQNDVDMLLLAGDLFHDANPSTSCYDRCVKLLRQYCMGDKPIKIEFLSDQSLNFSNAFAKTVNYEDPNLNVALPVFSIHGNHDDFSGFGNMSPLDLLSDTGLINYFGRWSDLTNVRINPIMLQKDKTKLAVYGLSYVHDNRLVRLFKDGKVHIERPEDIENWFNIFVLHQNRNDRGVKNYIPEDALPAFTDLVVWGHEHDCRIDPEKNIRKNFYITQPGSTVATSLSAGEALPKHCGILFINGKDFKLEKIPLKTVRPFVFRSIHVATEFEDEDLESTKMQDKVLQFSVNAVQDMLKEAEAMLTGHEKQPKLPLIRLRIEVTNECQMFNSIRFGDRFASTIANKQDIILFKRHIKKKEAIKLEKDVLNEIYDKADAKGTISKVEDVVAEYFNNTNQQLNILSADALAEFTRLVVHADAPHDKCKKIIDFYLNEATAFLEDATELESETKLADFGEKDEERFQQLLKLLDAAAPVIPTSSRRTPIDDIDDGSMSTGNNSYANDSNDEDYDPSDSSRRSSRGATVASSKSTVKGKKGGPASKKATPAKETSRANKSMKQPTPTPVRGVARTSSRSSRASQGVVYIDSSDDD